MRSETAPIVFLTLLLIVIAGGFAIFYMQFLPPEKVAISCNTEGAETMQTSISLLVNRNDGSVLMAGKVIDPKNISILNDTAIAAEWKHNNGMTRMFLDRITGKLEVELSEDGLDWQKTEFVCSNSHLRF